MTTSALRAYFFLLEGELPPPDASDDWFAPRTDPAVRSAEQVAIFERETRAFIEDLEHAPGDEVAVQALFYARAQSAFGAEKAAIRTYFRMLYLLLFGQPNGPRWGAFVCLAGPENFARRLRSRLDFPFGT